MKDEIISTQQAAAILGVAPESVARLVRQGVIDGFKLGRDWAIYRTSVERYKVQTENKDKHDPTRGKE